MKDISIGELLRDYINKLIDEGYDFSYASKKREALYKFCELHKDRGFKPEKIRTYFRKMLTKCLKEKGIDPRYTGAGKRGSRLVYTAQGECIPEPIPTTNLVKKPFLESNQEQSEQTQDQQSTYTIRIKTIAAFLAALYLTLKLKWGFLEDLTDDEKVTLAEMWQPAFQKYTSEKFALLVFPTIATMGLLAPKLYKARKLKKEKETEEAEKRKEDTTKDD